MSTGANGSSLRKAEEERYVRLALDLLGEHGVVLRATESPDFIAALASGDIGIEVTEATEPGIEESRKAHACLRAELQAQLDERRLPVTIVIAGNPPSFGRRLASPRARTRDIVGLVELGRRFLEAGTGPDHVGFDRATLRAHDVLCILHATFRRSSAPIAFVTDRADPVLNLPPHLQNRIESKGRRLPEYRKKAQTVWLLVVSTGSLASSIDIEPHRRGKLHSEFDRTLFLDVPTATVFDLAPCKPTA